MNRRQPHYRLTRLGRMLVVLAQAPIPPQPGERPFHHPTHLQGLKARHAFRPAHHHQAVRPPVQTQPGVQSIVVILVIREHHPQPRQIPAGRLGEHRRGGAAVVHIGGRHHHGDQQPQRVHQDMALAAVDLLAAVLADLLSALGRLDRLAVDGGGAGRWLPTGPDADLLTQRIENPLPGAVGVEPLEVVVDGLPGGEVVGQGPPGAALAGAVEQGVDDPTHIGSPGATARPGRRDERLDDCPLSVR